MDETSQGKNQVRLKEEIFNFGASLINRSLKALNLIKITNKEFNIVNVRKLKTIAISQRCLASVRKKISGDYPCV
jgi:hypothetical protein